MEDARWETSMELHCCKMITIIDDVDVEEILPYRELVVE
jgi:hypothetical protein